MRFEGEDVSQDSLRQLRGKEGTRMRKLYKELSSQFGVFWQGRNYDPYDFEAGDDINKALSTANYYLYGLCHAIINALGASPGLGIVHVGKDKSFVYDIANLYKAETTIPLAFQMVSESSFNLERRIRTNMRERLFTGKFIKRIIEDIFFILDDTAKVRTESRSGDYALG